LIHGTLSAAAILYGAVRPKKYQTIPFIRYLVPNNLSAVCPNNVVVLERIIYIYI
jgi:hypothetical protein